MQPLQKDVDDMWTKEVEERISALESGKVQLISGNEVFKEIAETFVR